MREAARPVEKKMNKGRRQFALRRQGKPVAWLRKLCEMPTKLMNLTKNQARFQDFKFHLSTVQLEQQVFLKR